MLKAEIPLLYQSYFGFGAIAFNVFLKQINTYRFFHEKNIIPVYKEDDVCDIVSPLHWLNIFLKYLTSVTELFNKLK
jgi:hypothetical protein